MQDFSMEGVFTPLEVFFFVNLSRGGAGLTRRGGFGMTGRDEIRKYSDEKKERRRQVKQTMPLLITS